MTVAVAGPCELGLWHASEAISAPESPAAWAEELETLVASGVLHRAEADEAVTLAPTRQGTFVAGRVALRRAWQDAHRAGADTVPAPVHPIGRTARGAPRLPPSLRGSISHKSTLAYAVATGPDAGWQHIGVDLERRPTPRDLARPSIARRILTAPEQARVQEGAIDEVHVRELVHLHFALKEAVYKAIDPLVGRYVAFTEVELQLRPTAQAGSVMAGTADVALPLPELANTPVTVSARWRIDGDWIVAVAGMATGDMPSGDRPE